MTKRQPVKALNLTTSEIAKSAAIEKARKTASKKALHAEIDPPKVKKTAAPKALPVEKPQDAIAAEHAAMRAALTIDAKAVLGEDASQADIDAYVAKEMDIPAPKAGSYTGPMIALRTAAKHYVKGTNGNPHSNDWLAASLAALDQPTVIRVLIKAMKLEGNPYIGLNNGQQSMNLRNKARGMVKRGELTQDDVLNAIKG